MLISIKQKYTKYGEHFKTVGYGAIEEVINTDIINSVRIDSECDFVLINNSLSIKKETWLEIKKSIDILEFDETKG